MREIGRTSRARKRRKSRFKELLADRRIDRQVKRDTPEAGWKTAPDKEGSATICPQPALDNDGEREKERKRERERKGDTKKKEVLLFSCHLSSCLSPSPSPSPSLSAAHFACALSGSVRYAPLRYAPPEQSTVSAIGAGAASLPTALLFQQAARREGVCARVCVDVFVTCVCV